MKFKRRIAREVVLLSLYQIDIANVSPEEAIDTSISLLEIEEEIIIDFARELFFGLLNDIDKVDSHIQSLSRKWKLSRMSYIDRNILRIAVYEMLYNGHTPYKIAINEAVELAKVYGDAKSSKFINGILASVVEENGLLEE